MLETLKTVLEKIEAEHVGPTLFSIAFCGVAALGVVGLTLWGIVYTIIHAFH